MTRTVTPSRVLSESSSPRKTRSTTNKQAHDGKRHATHGIAPKSKQSLGIQTVKKAPVRRRKPQSGPSWKLFPEYRSFDDKPPRRGTFVEGKGPTPLYALAWRFSPVDLVAGPSGGTVMDLESDFIARWADSFKTKAERKRIDEINRPLVLQCLASQTDSYLYFTAASNAEDPAGVTRESIKFAKQALPPKFMPYSKIDFDSDEVFGWFRTRK
ncbi:hypothetical protein HMN09_01147900 [Mycena chlorophos]|uniref:Uncharacterized protein n=1 Tax=Mycena chlorophos TaxID=658473 RepID=A0A8H6S8K3_MYCCL|nr:hypothetical protein HMN09_01147900 [Mycena chlorophos]